MSYLISYYILITSGLQVSCSVTCLFLFILLKAPCILSAAKFSDISGVSAYLIPVMEMDGRDTDRPVVDSPLAFPCSESSSEMTGTLIPLFAISFFSIATIRGLWNLWASCSGVLPHLVWIQIYIKIFQRFLIFTAPPVLHINIHLACLYQELHTGWLVLSAGQV